MHGFFDKDDFATGFIEAARAAVDLVPAASYVNINAERAARIDRLADHLRESLDMNLIKRLDCRSIRCDSRNAASLKLMARPMKAPFAARADQDALIVGSSRGLRFELGCYARWICHADHVINHHVSGDDRWSAPQPDRWLEESASRLAQPQGTVVAMATAVEIKNLVEVSRRRAGESHASRL